MSNNVNKNYKCVNCGGNLVFSAFTGTLFCPNCSSAYPIYNEKSFSKHIVKDDTSNNSTQPETIDYKNANKVFKCTNCGASVLLNNQETSGKCLYCDTALVLDNRNNNIWKPDAIIPFAFDRDKASVMFKEGVKKKWFLPNEFKRSVPSQNIEGFYLPVFSFDSIVTSTYNGVLESYDKERNNESSSLAITNFNISGTKKNEIVDYLIESSKIIDQISFQKIEPYDLNNLYNYKDEYVLGYSVEHCDKTLDSNYKIAQGYIKESIKKEILHGYSYDRVVSFNMTNTFENDKYAYYLLPSYEVKYNFKDKAYRTFMNGQTGKIGGGLPKSKVKIFFFVSTIILILAGIIACSVLLK